MEITCSSRLKSPRENLLLISRIFKIYEKKLLQLKNILISKRKNFKLKNLRKGLKKEKQANKIGKT